MGNMHRWGLLIVLIALLMGSGALTAQESQNHTGLQASSVFSDNEERDRFRDNLAAMQGNDSVCRHEIAYKHRWLHQGREGVERLSEQGLALIALLSRQFKEDHEIVRHIGALLMLDLKDEDQGGIIANEHGGLGMLIDGHLEVMPIISEGRYKLSSYTDHLGLSVTLFDSGSNQSFTMPSWAQKQIPHVFEYHQHAVPNIPEEFQRCAPSFGIDQETGALVGDIGYAMGRIDRFGETHQFVFIARPNRTFETIYYGGRKTGDDEMVVSAVVLPVQRY